MSGIYFNLVRPASLPPLTRGEAGRGFNHRTLVTTPRPMVRLPSRSADRVAALHRDRLVERDLHPHVVAGHDHLGSGELRRSGDVRGPEEELRLVAAEERRVPAAFVLAQDVDLTLELRAAAGSMRGGDHLAAPDLVGLDAAQQQADVLPGLAHVRAAG